VFIDGTLNDNTEEDSEWIMEMAIPLKLFDGINTFSPAIAGYFKPFAKIAMTPPATAAPGPPYSKSTQIIPMFTGPRILDTWCS